MTFLSDMAKSLKKKDHRRQTGVYLGLFSSQPLKDLLEEAEALAESRKLDPGASALLIAMCHRVRCRERIHPVEPEGCDVWKR